MPPPDYQSRRSRPRPGWRLGLPCLTFICLAWPARADGDPSGREASENTELLRKSTAAIALPGSGPLRPHAAALPNKHQPGVVDRPELVPFIIADPRRLPGIVVDETAATIEGGWRYSTHTPPYVGLGYIHSEKGQPGAKTATFRPDLPDDGLYEVRLAHCYNVRRASNTLVIIHHAGGETRLRINQQQEPEHAHLFRSLGTFRFAAGTSGWVCISNAGADEDKVVIADAVQWLPKRK